MKKILLVITILISVTVLFFAFGTTASAEIYGDLTYSVNLGEIEITDCNTSVTSVNIPDEINGYPVTKIKKQAFGGCASLKNVTIPDSIVSIDSGAFSGCSSLIDVVLPSGVSIINSDVFKACSSLNSIKIPVGVKQICSGAFLGCEKLKIINIPDSVTTIDEYAFCNCQSLTDIIIPDSVEFIGVGAFYGCISLKEITIPNNVTEIGSSTFYNCQALKEIIIPNAVKKIGSFAFYGCNMLNYMKLPFIGESTTALKEKAVFGYIFGYTYEWTNSSSATNDDGAIKQYSEFVRYWDTTRRTFYYYIPSSLRTVEISNTISIPENAFINCSGLKKITIPDFVETIGSEAFSGCSSLCEFKIPYSVKNFGAYTFFGCSLLKSIVIPDSVTKIGRCSFQNCLSLQSVSIPDTVTAIGESTFYGCKSLIEINIPDSMKYIGNNAFDGCRSLTEISVPDTVTYIGKGVFKNCLALEYLKVPFVGESLDAKDEKSLFGYIFGFSDEYTAGMTKQYYSTTSYKYFYIPESLREVEITGSADISPYAFNRCSMLTDIKINDAVIGIGTSAFEGCSCLVNFRLPSELIVIGSYALKDCSSLEYIVIPENITTIGSDCFGDCSGLKSVYVTTEKINTIPIETFSGCKSLERIYIPVTITDIQDNSFDYCWNLSDVYYSGTEDEWNKITIGSGNYYVTGAEYITGANIHFSHEHLCNEWQTDIPATCLKKGIKSLYCECGYGANITEIAPLGHDISKYESKAPTCEEEGWNAYEDCSRCDYTTCVKIKAIGHKRVSVQYEPPTCTENGICSGSYCSVCDKIFYGCEIIPAKGHDERTIKGKNATCTKDGYTETIKCNRCYIILKASEVIPKTGHSFIDEVVAPGCYSRGYTIHKCSVCQYWYKDSYVESTGHTYNPEIVPPTCTQSGYTIYKCTCGNYYYGSESVNPLGHNYKEEITAPTCTQAGYTKYSCFCGNWYCSNYVYAIGHIEEVTTGKSATCTETGLTEGKKCSVCGETLVTQEVIPALCHDYVSVITAPSCTEKGYTTYTCSCGDSYVDNYVEATGHTEDVITGKSATCIEKGLTEGKKCSVCGETLVAQEETPALGHDYVSVITAPSCTEKGHTTYTCSCGGSYVGNYVDATGHTEEVIAGKSATCTETGLTEGKKCSACSEILVEQEEIPATGHTEEVITGKSATCTEKGLTEGKKCSVCGEILVTQEEIPATGHDYVAVVTEPTCTEDGFTVYTCHCGDSYSPDEVVPSTGHTHGSWEVVVEAQVGEDGLEQQKCTVCGEVLDERVIPALPDVLYMTGDANGDGKITAADARIALRISARLDKIENYNLPIEAFDATGDGKLTAADARKILRVAAKIETF